MNIQPIAVIHNDFTDKFAIPRQSGIAKDVISHIELLNEYNDISAIRGIEQFSHIWLIWGFDKNIKEKHNLTVRPPRLGGNERVGVFASRSPFRPNNLGLSSVKLIEVKLVDNRCTLVVAGADLMNGTPIYDIKPYIPFSDCHTDANGGFIDENEFNILDVEVDKCLLNMFSNEQQSVLLDILSNDPRPAYQDNSERIYGFSFANKEIKFMVNNNKLKVVSIDD